MKFWLTLLTGCLLLGCNDVATGEGRSIDSVKQSFDSSAIMNDSTKLPQDSTNTGVMH